MLTPGALPTLNIAFFFRALFNTTMIHCAYLCFSKAPSEHVQCTHWDTSEYAYVSLLIYHCLHGNMKDQSQTKKNHKNRTCTGVGVT